MTKHSRTSSGKYSVAGKIHDMLIGTRAQVWHGTCKKTAGGLTKSHLMMNKHGRIVSRKQQIDTLQLITKKPAYKKQGFFGKLLGKPKKQTRVALPDEMTREIGRFLMPAGVEPKSPAALAARAEGKEGGARKSRTRKRGARRTHKRKSKRRRTMRRK